jgi:hypothetical protein
VIFLKKLVMFLKNVAHVMTSTLLAKNADGFAQKSENPSHGSVRMASSPLYQQGLKNRSNPVHGSAGIVQVHTIYLNLELT